MAHSQVHVDPSRLLLLPLPLSLHVSPQTGSARPFANCQSSVGWVPAQYLSPIVGCRRSILPPEFAQVWQKHTTDRGLVAAPFGISGAQQEPSM